MKILKAKTGTYTDREGQQKNKWTEIGVLNEGNDGGMYIILNRSVSIAGIGAQQDLMSGQQREGVMVSVFDPYDANQAPRQAAPQQEQASADKFDDDIPF